MKYAFIQCHEGHYPVQAMCKALDCARSGYYKWQQSRVNPRRDERRKLLTKIKDIHESSRGSYGSPRIHKELEKQGIRCNHKTVEKAMKENKICSKRKRKFKVTTDSKHNLPVAENLLDQDFKTVEPNTVWVSDISYLRTDEGWLYLAVFIDLFSRKVVGWSMSPRMPAELIVNAFRMALFRQGRKAPIIVHSDRGSQYASDLFRTELASYGCHQSMSKKGDCFDNAVAESFFGALKTELVYQEKFRTKEEARLKVFDYIETFYNAKRLHSYLGYLSPNEFEHKMVQVS